MKVAEIILNETLVEDMRKCKDFIQNGQNEVFHNIMLKLLPKRVHYPIKTQITRMMIGSLEVDENTGFNLRKPKERVKYSRGAGEYILKNEYSGKTYYYRGLIMDKIQDNMKKNVVLPIDWSKYIKADVPKNIWINKKKPSFDQLRTKARAYKRM